MPWFRAEIDEHGWLWLRGHGVATFSRVGRAVLNPERIPILEGVDPHNYERADRPAEVCRGCGRLTADWHEQRYQGQVNLVCDASGDRCFERVKKQIDRAGTPRKDGKPHRWETPADRSLP
jgi:hypothetical protein